MMKGLQRAGSIIYNKSMLPDTARGAIYTTAVCFGGLLREAIRVLADRNPFVDTLRGASCSRTYVLHLQFYYNSLQKDS